LTYENPTPREDVNVSHEHPLKEFAQLIIGLGVVVIIAVLVLGAAAGYLAKYIPIEYEQKMVDQIGLGSNPDTDFLNSDALSEEDQKIQQRLQSLADKLTAHMDLPEGADIKVHYSSSDTVNALATLGGNLVFFKGLLEKIETEEELAAVMAHEIAHVQHRDPIAGFGGGIASSVALLAMAGNSGTGPAGKVLNNAGLLTSIQFTRRMEIEADIAALTAVNDVYGHVNGADMLFQVLKSKGASDGKVPEALKRFTETHPALDDRIERISTRTSEEGWDADGEITPLPDDFKNWLRLN